MIKLVKLDTQQMQSQQASPHKQTGGSPQKMVVLAAESNEMLAQLMRASASLLSQNMGVQLPVANALDGSTPERQHMIPQPMAKSPCKRLTPYNER